MEFQVNVLKTAEECQTAIKIILAEKTQLERRKRNLGENIEGKANKSIEVSEGIDASKAIINGFQAAIDVITDDRVRRDFELKIEREEAKLKSLENRQANYNIINLIEDQIDHQQIEAQIPILETAITKIEARKAEI